MTTDEINALARAKAKGSNALERQWLLTLQRLQSTGLSDELTHVLIEASASPNLLDRLARRLGDDPAARIKLLMEDCDNSPHALPKWIDAMDALYAWLEERGRTASMEQVIGYISCSSAGAPDTDLKWTVLQMLDQYGMDRQ